MRRYRGRKEMIVHISSDDKFMPDYIQLINENFDAKQHLFLILSFVPYMKYVQPLRWENVIILHKDVHCICTLYKQMRAADKIIIHGLFSRILLLMGLLLPDTSKKEFFAPWGGDMNWQEDNRIILAMKRQFLSHIAGVIISSKRWYAWLQQHYRVNCRYFLSIVYPSNVVRRDRS